ncbi:hypothetical protein KIH31_09390 [Paenarthrobacter sp. DKR-5]|uniref:hypothetical protein n=1 Tax=Paenarthrobacter sp. DKR-5 TaxID=2835535 RepID=UPI001BDC0A0A|nr:hypothetical protein [Paenarthrobacter sp. DKR-5]MBT1002818.1 hypothetical protein [Paenarthrobacter sp. DKR-5]
MTAVEFENVCDKAFFMLEKAQERLRSDWLFDETCTAYDPIDAVAEARRHIAGAKAALLRLQNSYSAPALAA